MTRRYLRFAIVALTLWTSVNGCSEAETTAPCEPRPAILLEISADGAPLATVIYNRHGDDTLSTLQFYATGAQVPIGNAPGYYDFRVVSVGFADLIRTNYHVRSDACGAARTGGFGTYLRR
jgi:hypothetical protein